LITLLSGGGVWNEMESGGIAKHRSNAAVHGRWSEDKQRTEHCLGLTTFGKLRKNKLI
jgi:hypothetical protein